MINLTERLDDGASLFTRHDRVGYRALKLFVLFQVCKGLANDALDIVEKVFFGVGGLSDSDMRAIIAVSDP